MGNYVHLWYEDNKSYASNNTVRMIIDVLVDGANAQKQGKKSCRGKFGCWERERMSENFIGVLHDEQGNPSIAYVADSFYNEIMVRGFGYDESPQPLKFNGVNLRKGSLTEDFETELLREMQIIEVPNASRYIDSHIHGVRTQDFVPI